MKAFCYLVMAYWLAGSSVGASESARAGPSMRDVLTATYAVRDLNDVEITRDGKAVAWEEDFHDRRDLLHSPLYSAVYERPIAGEGEFVSPQDAQTDTTMRKIRLGLQTEGRSRFFPMLDRRANSRCLSPAQTVRTCAKSADLTATFNG